MHPLDIPTTVISMDGILSQKDPFLWGHYQSSSNPHRHRFRLGKAIVRDNLLLPLSSQKACFPVISLLALEQTAGNTHCLISTSSFQSCQAGRTPRSRYQHMKSGREVNSLQLDVGYGVTHNLIFGLGNSGYCGTG